VTIASSARRRLTLAIHALIFLAAATQFEITPLLPHIEHRFGVAEAATALLVAAPGVATLAVGIPIGLLTDRLGAQRVTVAAALLLSLGAAGQALPSFAAILAARFLFGISYGAILTAGPAWLAAATDGGAPARLGATVTSASVGVIVGPALGGLLGEQLGIAAPLLLSAALGMLMTVALLACPAGRPVARGAGPAAAPWRELVAARRAPAIMAAAGGLAISGAVGGATQLLGPLGLHRAGASAGAIGLIFSASALIYLLVSAVVVATGRRAISTRVNAIAALGIAATLIPAVLSGSAAALTCVLLLMTIPRATVGTISYPLAAGAGVSRGVAIGLVNAAWASGLVATPLLAGVLSPELGTRGVFTVILAITLAGAAALIAVQLRGPRAGRRPAQRTSVSRHAANVGPAALALSAASLASVSSSEPGPASCITPGPWPREP
jgi:MFS transporter, DHA1 family, solute carrier family 18 (vesicular amine transporter), member 1/2